MSVTTPICMSGAWATDAAGDSDAAADASADADAAADAGADASTDGAAADGVGLAPLEHAESRMAALPNSVRPRERVRMCPPRYRAPIGRSTRVASEPQPLRPRSHDPDRSRRNV